MTEEAPPPSYDSVVAGTWHQDNNISLSAHSSPVSLSSVRFNNDFLPSPQQSLPPPSYNETIVETFLPSADDSNSRENNDINNGTDNHNSDDDDDDDSSNIWGGIVLFCIGSPIPIAMVSLGLSNLENCSDSNIPIYSVVSGILSVIIVLFACMMMMCVSGKGLCARLSIGCTTFMVLAHFGVQCWGSAIVFGKWQHWKKDDFACDQSTYLLCFSTLIVYWVLGLCMCKLGSG